jgi:hypothetical protein
VVQDKEDPKPTSVDKAATQPPAKKVEAEEIGGAKGPDPTRYGDWQHKGRVSDF